MLHYHSHVPDSAIFVCLFKLHLFPDMDLSMWSRCYYLITIIIITIIINNNDDDDDDDDDDDNSILCLPSAVFITLMLDSKTNNSNQT